MFVAQALTLRQAEVMSCKKGEQTPELTTVLPPMPNPSAGSANPSVSLSALWAYIQPALDHIFCSPTSSVNKAPAIEFAYHMGIHAALYNYFIAQSQVLMKACATSPLQVNESTITAASTFRPAGGKDVYECLDKYYVDVAQKLLLGAPKDDTMLIQYIIPSFKHYSTGVHATSRLLNYINRHYVTHALDDYGWFTLGDLLNAVAVEEVDTRKKITKIWRARRAEELKKWGYEENGSADLLNLVERRAQAASSVDRVIPLDALAMRRFRTEFVEPLMAAPKTKGEKHKPGAAPKSRLGRAVQEILESEVINAEEQRTFVTDLAAILCAVSIRNGHPLRKKLEKY